MRTFFDILNEVQQALKRADVCYVVRAIGKGKMRTVRIDDDDPIHAGNETIYLRSKKVDTH